MPYIKSEIRKRLDPHIKELIAILIEEGNLGCWNYVVSRLVDSIGLMDEGLRYQSINDIIGVLECAKLEFYRRVAAPYEDRKQNLNGEVYGIYP